MFHNEKLEDMILFRRAYVIDNVCHGQEGYKDCFFHVYMTFFIELYILLSFDKFTMCVLCFLNVASTKLHSGLPLSLM